MGVFLMPAQAGHLYSFRMAIPALVFALTHCVLVRLPDLPGPELLSVAVPVALAGCLYSRTRWLCALALASWVVTLEVAGERGLRVSVAERIEGLYTGRIEGLPVHAGPFIRFGFQPSQGELQGRRLSIVWYQVEGQRQPVPRAGETWQLRLRISPPGGSVNARVFDYEQWQFVKRIHGRGHVMSSADNVRLAAAGFSVDAMRERMRDFLATRVPADQLGTFLALALGDTSALTQRDWQILNATGTTHLLIVSGLHVGFIAMLTFVLLRLIPVPFSMTVVLTMLATGGYALLAGWGLPVQRAFVMTSVFLLARLIRRNTGVFTQLLAALVLILLMDPLASLASGFWLSFGAVAVLLAGLSGLRLDTFSLRGKLEGGLRAQLLVYAGLMPLLAAQVGTIPFTSILVNLVAIPLTGLALVPMLSSGLLLAMLVPNAGIELLQVTGFVAWQLWRFLAWFAGFPLVLPVSGPGILTLCLAISGALILLLPAGRGHRWIGLLLLATLLLRPERLPAGDMRVTFLDVGQGLAVLIETSTGATLYDTGPAFPGGFSAASHIILPTLRQRGYRRLEAMIISHGDNDHAGGREILSSQFPVLRQIDTLDCDARWQQDQVYFRTFSLLEKASDSNDASCLLYLVHGDVSLLLTGDIEARGEQGLLTRGLPPVSVLSAPHHGSRTSSSPAMLNQLRPDLVVVSAGYGNRFGHPDARIVERYRRRHSRVMDTAFDGAVTIYSNSRYMTVESARATMDRVWRIHRR
ncbi:MAG: DNA internalization-related competence protein ComEC/Rec2 [Proteobacteria bacterium]|nr:DNA internalization-related competence protein ComEC/Rec2 [Pseudomonadota bacterium]